jgi:hypothetical protein
MKHPTNLLSSLLLLALAGSCAPALGQSTPPFLTVTDSSGTDTNVDPLLMVIGGDLASTLGIEVTSQSAPSTLSGTPTWSNRDGHG